MRDKIETYLIVTVITLLIWLYAESENVKRYPPLPINVQFVPATGPLSIQPSKPQQVWVTVQCATSQYAKFERLAKAAPIELQVHEVSSGPDQVLILSQMLRQTQISDLGIHIVDVQPPTIPVRVERLEEVTLTVSTQSIVPKEIQLAEPPTLEHATATVLVPASAVEAIGKVQLQATLNPGVLERIEENVPTQVDVHLTLPEDIATQLNLKKVMISPTKTRAGFTIRKRQNKETLKSLPILLLGPWLEMQRFNVEIEGGRRVLNDDVQVAGPSDVMEQIRKGEKRVWAELRLTVDELESRISNKQVYINLPEGVTVESAIPRVNFEITPIEPGVVPNSTP